MNAHVLDPEPGQYADRCLPCLQAGRKTAATRHVGGKPMCDICFGRRPKVARAPGRNTRLARVSDLAVIVAARAPLALDDAREAALPYLRFASAMFCLACGGPRVSVRPLCQQCTDSLNVIRNVKSWLRCYQRSGNIKCLRSALSNIRRYSLVPEDLRDY